jgi:hypothetical protein
LLKQLDETKDSIYLEDYLTIQNSNNIEKLLQLESIEICKQISLLEKTLFNRYYNIIVTNCSVDFINQLIETNIFDIQKITQNNADNYLILLENVFSYYNINHPDSKGFKLAKYFIDKGWIRWSNVMWLIWTRYIYNNHYYHYSNLQPKIDESEILKKNKLSREAILLLNYKYKVPMPTFEQCINYIKTFRWKFVSTNIVNIYNFINSQSLENITLHYNKKRSVMIIENTWFMSMWNTKYVYCRIYRLIDYYNLMDCPIEDCKIPECQHNSQNECKNKTNENLKILINNYIHLKPGVNRYINFVKLKEIICKQFPESNYY